MDQRSKIGILGFGVEGRAVFDYLLEHGYDELTVCDVNVDLDETMPDGVSVRLGPGYLDELEDFEVIFRSPGIRYYDPKIQAAIAAGVEVTSSTGFFMDQCPCPVIGVTGTKGKGTTATLIYEILKAAGKKVYLAGNIGEPAIALLDELKGDGLVVLELSSFQLQDLSKSPHYAVLLNTTKDHLDYHVDRDEYLQAKESLLAHQLENHLAVLNKDYEYAQHYAPLVKGGLKWVSVQEKVKDGVYVEDGRIWYGEEEICETGEVALIGSHNLENVMPAVVIAKELGVANGTIRSVVKEFAGLPHRLEFVEEKKGVKYYNDSFSTTPETSMAAVDSFDEPTVLIAGGYDKGLEYGDWALKILTKPSLKTVVLVGDTAEMMEEALEEGRKKLGEAEGSETDVLRAKDMKEAVEKAASAAEDGGVVVMSPASSSFDLYKNYKERGKKFMEEVRSL